MGRLEPSTSIAPQAHRKDQRAKQARVTINKTIPAILASDARARMGVERAELIVDPQLVHHNVDSSRQSDSTDKSSRGRHKGKRRGSAEEDEKELSAPTKAPTQTTPLRIQIRVSDTLVAAQKLHLSSPRSRKNVAILNMASPLRPGGGVLNGATSQEETICVRSTLLPTLKEEWYRLPEVGAVWSPDVCVFRVPNSNAGPDIELGKGERFYVDVISAGMLRFPEVTSLSKVRNDADADDKILMEEKVFANPKDREMALHKMRAVMRILQAKGTEVVVLGAWGCGAYGNPLGEIVAAWKKTILGNRKSATRNGKDPYRQGAQWSQLKEVVFAIKDWKTARDFAALWGPDIDYEESEKSEVPRKMIDDEDERDLEELETKIKVLEGQLEQVKTPLLRRGIEDTLIMLHQMANQKESDIDCSHFGGQ